MSCRDSGAESAPLSGILVASGHCGLAALRVTGRGDGELVRDPDS